MNSQPWKRAVLNSDLTALGLALHQVDQFDRKTRGCKQYKYYLFLCSCIMDAYLCVHDAFLYKGFRLTQANG